MGTLRKLFNLYPGEAKGAFCFLVLGFLWSLGAFGGLTLSEGMFLEHVGALMLPKSYIITALTLCFFSTLLLIAIHRLSISYLFSLILISSFCCNLGLYFLLQTCDSTWVWYLYKVVGWIIPIATYICFWAFIDQYFDLQDAKRFFCLFNSILYLGDACAGGLISFTLETIGTEKMLLIFMLSFLLALPLVFYIAAKKKPVPEVSVDGNPQRTTSSLKQIFKSILSSPFTLTLMLFYFIMQLIVITTEFSYMETFEKSFSITQGSHSLTEFLGTLAMWVSLGNMFFGLFFYSRIVTKFGVNNLILVAPLFFVLLFALWSSREGLFIATLGFIAREGMIYTFDDNNLLLLVSGVPSKVKNQVRIAIETFFEPIGMLIGAALLFFLTDVSVFTGLLLSLLAFGFVLILRTQYPKAIFSNLIALAVDFDKKVASWFLGRSKKELAKLEFTLLSYLKKGDDTAKLLAFECLIKMHPPSHLSKLLNQFTRFSIKGKQKMIEVLLDSDLVDDPQVIDCFEKWSKITPHPSIRSQIHFYLAKHKSLKKEIALNDLASDHLGLKGSAILALKTSSENLSQTLLALENLKRLLDSKDENEIMMGLEILGYEKRHENLSDLWPYLTHPSTCIQRQAAKAISLCSSFETAHMNEKIIDHLTHTSEAIVRMHLLKALAKGFEPSFFLKLIVAGLNFRPSELKLVEKIIVPIGNPYLPDLLNFLQDQSKHIRSRLLCAKIVAKISPSHLKSHLHQILDEELSQAYFYLYHSENIKEYREGIHDLAILKDALFTSYRTHLDFIVELIALSASCEECNVLSMTLNSKNRKIRAHAIESLEKMIDPPFFDLITPLIDARNSKERAATFVKRGIKLIDLHELLDVLEHSPSLANRIVSLTLKARLKLPQWQMSLKERLQNEKPLFHHFAAELLEN